MADDITYTSTSPAGVPNSTKQATDEHATRGHMPIVKLAYSADGDATHVTADANGLEVQGAGTAGTPAGGVVSVQGVASGTVLPVSDGGGTLSVDDGAGSLTVDGTVAVSGTVAVTQSGTWDEVGINDSGNSITVDNPALSVTGGGLEASAVRVTLASDSTGLVSVDDNGGSLTVDGTVAVSGTVAVTQSGTWDEVGINDSGNSITVDNAALSVTGGGVEASALRVTLANDSTGVLSVDDNGSTISVDDGAGSLTVDGTVTANLAAGTNNIGDVDILTIAAGDNNIGNVDVVTLPALPTGTNTIGSVKITDGTTVATVRELGTNDSLNVAVVDGSGNQITSFGGGTQYTEADTDASITGTAVMWEDAADTLRAVSSSKPLPVNVVAGGAGDGSILDGVDTGIKATVLDYTSANPLAVRLSDTNGDYVSAGAGTQYTEDAAAAANPVGTALIMVREDARAGSLTTTDGDNVAARGNNKGELYVKSTDSDALLTTIDGDTGNISTKIDTLAGAVAGTEMQVDVLTMPTVTVNAHAVTNAGTFAVQSTNQTGDNTIGRVKITDGTDVADVLDLTSSNPLAVAIVDSAGDQITSFGGGTQYTEGDADASITGTAVMWEDGSNVLRAASAAKPLPVEIIAGGGTGGTSAADDADFTAGTTAGTPAQGVYESTPTSVTDGDLGTVGITQGRRLKTSATIDAALPAGTNAIGKLAANSGVDIGDVDITSIAAGDNNIGNVDIASIAAGDNNIGNVDVASSALPTGASTLAEQQTQTTALQLIDDTVFAEDVAAQAADKGIAVLAVRRDADTSLVGTSNDYANLQVDANGYLKVEIFDGGGSHTVDATSLPLPTGASTLAEQQTQTTALQLIDDTVYVDDADWTADTSKHTLVGGVTQVASTANTDGDVTPLTTNAMRELRTAIPESDLATAGTAHVKKYYTNAGAVTDGIIWSPAAGKRWFVTDLIISVSAAATVTLEDDKAGGDEAVMKFELAANSGISHTFNTPWFSGEDAADLIITTSAGNVYVTCVGYEI